jgi:glycerol uptake facilitator-like aquaporin
MDYLPLLGEFLGSWLLVLSILATGNYIVIGFTLALVIFLLSKTSGGHVNPAVTLAFFLKGSLSTAELVGYLVAQMLGGAVSFYTYKVLA